MPNRIILLFAMAGSSLGAMAAEPRLIPYPQSVAVTTGDLALTSPVRICLASKAQEDGFAAGILSQDLKAVAGLHAVFSKGKPCSILIGRANDPPIDKEITRRKLDRAALERSESYLLHVDRTGVLVASRTTEGVFYGIQTLRQLVLSGSSPKGARLSFVSIADWPALRYRGLSWDISRGPIPTEEQMKSVIRTLAEYKMNMLSLYMEHVFEYSHAPGITREGGAITAELMKRIIEYGRQYHVELLPQQQTFGHLHHVLKVERYAGMAEIPFGRVLSVVNNDRAYEWIGKNIAELAALFPSGFVHVGGDEVRQLGQGRSREYVKQAGLGAAYTGHMQKVFAVSRPTGKRLMFWGDMALAYPDQIPKLPKEMVAMSWHYGPLEDFSARIAPFRDAGMDVFVCPGLRATNRIFPGLGGSLVNINNFVRDGKRLGALGMLNTYWADDGEGLFGINWYGIVFSAAAAWQQGLVDTGAFDRAFDWAFYRHTGETFARSIRRLDSINSLLVSAGVGEAYNDLFWFDPFSRLGAERVGKILPIASELRLRAEDALADLTSAAERARLHRDTIPFLRFAARRLDCLGMKVQISKAIADAYREALTDRSRTAGNLSRISSGNGLTQDMRDYVHELKGMFRDVWLSENRPYWLDNVLIRYDSEALFWVLKSRLFERLAEECEAAKTDLPPPEALGLWLP
jgi:hypothetical protein